MRVWLGPFKKRGTMPPQYVLKPNLKRLFIPQIFKLIALGALLYLGVYVNIEVFEIGLSKNIFYMIYAAITLIITSDLILIYLKYSKQAYDFYSDRVEIKGKRPETIYFSQILNISFKRNFLDKIFNTGTIILGDSEIISVENSNRVYFYIQKLVDYGRNGGYR